MSIEIGSKWVKDGEVVEIKDITETVGRDEVIYYKCKQNKLHVMYDYDFLEQYKHYEPVYEYKYVIGSTEFQKITNKFYKSDEELMSSEDTYGFIGQSFQRLDFTKIERKQ